jgi:nucleoside 2-deoxyribosyltransferase
LPEHSPEALQSFAEQIVSLVERVITPRDVFVIMSFGKDLELEDAYETFCAVYSRFNFNAFRVDHHVDETKRIVHEVIDSIRRSAFIIADVSGPRPNVYYEMGWGQALGKPVIVTAKEGTKLEFDIYDIPTVYWNNQRSLREGLTKRVERIASRAGR